MATAAALECQEFPLPAEHSSTRTGMTKHEAGDAADFLAEFAANQGEFSVQSEITLDFNTIDRFSLISRAREILTVQGIVVITNYAPRGEIDAIRSDLERVCEGVGLVWKIHVIDLVRFWCRDGRPKTAIRDNGPLQGRILSRRQGRAGEGGNAPHRQKRYDAVS